MTQMARAQGVTTPSVRGLDLVLIGVSNKMTDSVRKRTNKQELHVDNTDVIKEDNENNDPDGGCELSKKRTDSERENTSEPEV